MPAAEAATLEVVFPVGQGTVRIGESRLCPRTCTREVEPGLPVTTRVAAADGYVFAGWDDATPCAEGNGAVCTATMPETGLRLIPLFEVKPRDDLVIELFGPGRIERLPGWRCTKAAHRCRVPAPPGVPLKIDVAPAAGRTVAYWSVWECTAPSTTCAFTTDARRTVSVYLTPVTVTVRGHGPGAVGLGQPFRVCGLTCTREFPWGANVTARVTTGAAAFLGWDAEPCGARTTCTFPVREPTRLNPRFRYGGGGGGGTGGDGDGQGPVPLTGATAGKNIVLTIAGRGQVYIFHQRRFCRSGATCRLTADTATTIRLRADGPFVGWRSTTCRRKQNPGAFKARYVDSVRAEFRRWRSSRC